MKWAVELHEEFDAEFGYLAKDVQDELLAQAAVIECFGPQTGRPRVDTLNGSCYANMKELRFDADGGVWRVAFAFDPRRHAVLLVAVDKSGGGEKTFYRHLIKKADERYGRHLLSLQADQKVVRKGKGAKKHENPLR
jgi:hypothetical protein